MMVKRKSARVLTLSKVLTWTGSLGILLLILRDPEAAEGAMRRGLAVCTDCLIPSVLPFLFFSQLLLLSDFGAFCARHLGKITTRLFHLPPACAEGILLSVVFGFPAGVHSVLRCFDRGTLSKQEANRLLGCCSIPGPAFIIGTVGQVFFGSRKVGVWLYLFLAAASLAVAVLTRPRTVPKTGTVPPAPPALPFGQIISPAISAAARAMLIIVTYYLFFTCLFSCFSPLIALLPPFPGTMLLCTAELSTGLLAAASLGGFPGLFAAGFCAGFGSLSVALQVKALAGSRDLCMGTYFLCRLAIGLCCGLGLWMTFRATPPPESIRAVFMPARQENLGRGVIALSLLLLGSCLGRHEKRLGVKHQAFWSW